MTDGAFDSHNIPLWDSNCGQYRCYSRYFMEGEVRGVQSASSADFLHWQGQTPNRYGAGDPIENFYTNATLLCPGAEHIYLSFPMRFLPDRQKWPEHSERGLSDAVFMTSRDGVHWDRTFKEAWIRPGGDPRNWTDRNMMVASGCVEGGRELSFYVAENYRWDSLQLRRYTVRKHGFASLHAGYEEGEALTRPIRFTGSRLLLNYATSAAGSIRVEVTDADGEPIPGFTFAEMEPLFGDELEGEARWTSGADLSRIAGQPIRLRLRLQDADVYALRFA
jgi:hypothetical protein